MDDNIHLHLKKAQLTKARKRQTIQLSYDNFHLEPNVVIVMGKRMLNKVTKAKRDGKGCRIKDYNMEEMEGGSLKSIGNSISKAFKSKTGRFLTNLAVDAGTSYAQQNGYVDAKQAQALRNSGHDVVAGNYGSAIVNSLGAIPQSQDTSGAGMKRRGMMKPRMIEQHEEYHGGAVKKHLIKGSKEAKEHMAKIRAMRTSCKGDGILSDIKQGFTKGYRKIILRNGELKKTFLVHRLVAEAFILKTDKNLQVNHKNGIKDDNRIENLEWITYSENHLHAYATGLRVYYGYKKTKK